MANIAEIDEFTAGVYQLEITDPLEGGSLGVLNKSNKALANRTLWLKNRIVGNFPNEMKWLGQVNNAFITANFTSGVGFGAYAGWNIANGANGTIDMGGLVPVAYGNGYTQLGAVGGSKDAVVVSHTHTVNQIKGYGPTQGADGFYDRSQGESPYGIVTESTGVSGTNKNMQPYIVLLCIQWVGF